MPIITTPTINILDDVSAEYLNKIKTDLESLNSAIKAQENIPYFHFEENIEEKELANGVKTMSFPSLGSPNGIYTMDLQKFDTAQDIQVLIIFSMDTVGSSDVVKLDLEYKEYSQTGDLTDFTGTATTNQEFTVQDSKDTMQIFTFTTLKINNTDISSSNNLLKFKLLRNNTTSGTNHAGNFNISSLIFFQ